MQVNEVAVREGIAQVLSIARDRNRTLEALKRALLTDDDENIRIHAARLCGLPSPQSSMPRGQRGSAIKIRANPVYPMQTPGVGS